MKYTCPCCGYTSLDYKIYDICDICFWEDDKVQFLDPNFEGGANGISLMQAQKNFIEFGACDESSIDCVRKPNEDDVKDVNWKKYV